MINNRFPKIHLCFVPLESNPEIAGAFQVFVEPTILVFFEGKESIRKSRNLGLNELNAAIERPYDLIFSD